MSNVSASQLRRGFGPIHRKLSRCGSYMTSSAKIVFANLLEHQGQNSRAWPSQLTIAKETNLSERTVRDAIKEVASCGFLTITQRGQGKPNLYEICVENVLAWAEHRPVETAGLDLSDFADPEQQDLPVKNGTTRRSIHTEELPNEGIPKEVGVARRSPLHAAYFARWPGRINATTLADLEGWALTIPAEEHERVVNLAFAETDRAGADWRYTMKIFQRLESDNWEDRREKHQEGRRGFGKQAPGPDLEAGYAIERRVAAGRAKVPEVQ